ncbi:helix-turn-helix domain-containing protein [Chitinophagaceae bacterium LWZ2-11]
MLRIQYYKSPYKEWMEDYARALSEATGENVTTRGNSLLFPPELATGRYEFYEVGDGLGLLLMDYTFLRSVEFTQTGWPGNDVYSITYVLFEDIKFTNKEGMQVDIDNRQPHAAFLTSQSSLFKYEIKENVQVKGVQLFFNRSWGMKNLIDNSIPLNVKKMRLFAGIGPVQIAIAYSYKTKTLIDEIFENNKSRLSKIYLMEGYACKLAAFFFNDFIEKSKRQKNEKSEDVMRVIHMKESIEQNLDDIPSITVAAKECLMSETKFLQIFKTLYTKNYGAFFVEIRMKKAKTLLDEGKSVTDTGYAIGYREVGTFSKAFKEYFDIGPREYIKGSKQDK